jgi:hypothetical protein
LTKLLHRSIPEDSKIFHRRKKDMMKNLTIVTGEHSLGMIPPPEGEAEVLVRNLGITGISSIAEGEKRNVTSLVFNFQTEHQEKCPEDIKKDADFIAISLGKIGVEVAVNPPLLEGQQARTLALKPKLTGLLNAVRQGRIEKSPEPVLTVTA